MTPLFSIVVLTMLTGCVAVTIHTGSSDVLGTGGSSLPVDVGAFSERLAGCAQFSGEMGDSARDRAFEISQAIAALGCERIEKDVRKTCEKYFDDPQV